MAGDRPANDAPHRLIADDVELGEGVVVQPFTNLYGCRVGDGHADRDVRRDPARGGRGRTLQDPEPYVHLRRRDDRGRGVRRARRDVRQRQATRGDRRGRRAEGRPTTGSSYGRSSSSGASIGSGVVVLGGVRIGSARARRRGRSRDAGRRRGRGRRRGPRAGAQRRSLTDAQRALRSRRRPQRRAPPRSCPARVLLLRPRVQARPAQVGDPSASDQLGVDGGELRHEHRVRRGPEQRGLAGHRAPAADDEVCRGEQGGAVDGARAGSLTRLPA